MLGGEHPPPVDEGAAAEVAKVEVLLAAQGCAPRLALKEEDKQRGPCFNTETMAGIREGY